MEALVQDGDDDPANRCESFHKKCCSCHCRSCCRRHNGRYGEIPFQVLYTIGPIAAASVLVWVGAWGMLDLYLFPTNKRRSAIASIVIATCLAALCRALPPLPSLPSQQQSFPRVALIALLGINYWRGVWHLWEELVFPDNLLAQAVTALVLGMVILVLTNHFRSNVVGPPILFPESPPPPPQQQQQQHQHDEEQHSSSNHDKYRGNNLEAVTTTTTSEIAMTSIAGRNTELL